MLRVLQAPHNIQLCVGIPDLTFSIVEFQKSHGCICLEWANLTCEDVRSAYCWNALLTQLLMSRPFDQPGAAISCMIHTQRAQCPSDLESKYMLLPLPQGTNRLVGNNIFYKGKLNDNIFALSVHILLLPSWEMGAVFCRVSPKQNSTRSTRSVLGSRCGQQSSCIPIWTAGFFLLSITCAGWQETVLETNLGTDTGNDPTLIWERWNWCK